MLLLKYRDNIYIRVAIDEGSTIHRRVIMWDLIHTISCQQMNTTATSNAVMIVAFLP